ncbi:MAG: EamA family transporter [Leptospiraceae bacterium]|nr:EamA family transporter [Leptospiraceae bacterium]
MGNKNQSSNPANPTPEKVQNKAQDHQHNSSFATGVIIILISSMVISFQNIITRVILSKKVVLGVWETGGFISPSMGNSILILVLRMLIALPILAFLVAPRIYHNTWPDVRSIFDPQNKTKFYSSIGSGVFLFLSSFSIYLALGSIPTGVATTIFFIYPTVIILLLWIFFKEKPALSLVFAMATIYIGGFLTIPEESFHARGEGNILVGAISAAIAGITFAGYVIMIRIAKMHPAPFSIISFTTILILGSLMLPLFDWHVEADQWTPLLIGTVALAVTTLVGYLLNNFGVPIIGPALTSVISASGPAVTALFALVIINETLTLHQVIGVSLVTLWVIGISVENLKKVKPAPPKPEEAK